LRQMVVLAASYIELMLKDFFECLFRAQPLRMHPVLAADSKQALIALNELVQAPTKEHLLASLAERAARKQASREPDKLFKELVTDCRVKCLPDFLDKLRSLKELRNVIVHAGTDEQLAIERIHDAFGLVLYVLYVLAQIAEEYKLACWDDTSFLRDFTEKLTVA